VPMGRAANNNVMREDRLFAREEQDYSRMRNLIAIYDSILEGERSERLT
jgi:hypothetical protein